MLPKNCLSVFDHLWGWRLKCEYPKKSEWLVFPWKISVQCIQCVKSVPIRNFLVSIFPRLGWISIRMRDNTDQKNSEYIHFLRIILYQNNIGSGYHYCFSSAYRLDLFIRVLNNDLIQDNKIGASPYKYTWHTHLHC